MQRHAARSLAVTAARGWAVATRGGAPAPTPRRVPAAFSATRRLWSSREPTKNPHQAAADAAAAAADAADARADVAEEAATNGDAEATAAAAEADAEALAADLQAAATANAALKDRLVRALADMENLRERTARQAESAKAFAVQGLVKSLLDVADNLERAREAAGVGADAADADATAPKRLSALVEGVDLTERVLLSAFRGAGVERFDPAGALFDPNEMEAVFQVPPSPGGPPAGHVAAVAKVGYRLNGRVVRPAQVGVAREG